MTEPEHMSSPGGTVYTLKKGTGKFGYEGVFEPHKGYHAKLRLDDSKGVKADTHPRSGVQDAQGGGTAPCQVSGGAFRDREEGSWPCCQG